MMTATYFLLTCFVLLAVGLSAGILRSHAILVMASFNMATTAAVLVLITVASADKISDAIVMGCILLCLSALTNFIFCGAIVLIFRSRGKLRMDDYRDLRG